MIRQLLVLGTLVLAACGGGGDGGDDEATTVDVTMSVPAGTALNASVAKGRRIENARLTGKVTGNLSVLNGKTVYVIVEDPAGLFFPSATVSAPNAQGDVTLELEGRPLDSVGDFRGNLTVRACLDSACKTQLRGSPLRVPFHVAVTAGLGFPTTTLEVSAKFGSPPFSRTLTGAPAGKLSNFSWGSTISPDERKIISLDPQSQSQPTDPLALNVLFRAAAPGTHVKEFSLSGQIEAADGSTYWATEIITVRYTVTDDPGVDYAFSTPPLVLNVTNPWGLEADIWAVGRTGVTLTWRGMEYLTHPPEANGLAHATAWWNETGRYVSGCPMLSSRINCLPAGTYTARAHYTMTKAGVTSEVYLPVTMNIAP